MTPHRTKPRERSGAVHGYRAVLMSPKTGEGAMIYRAYMTGDVTTFTGEDGDYTTEYGWVDASDLHTLEESRNYVQPVSEWDPRDTQEYATAAEWRAAVVAEHFGPAAQDNGDGTVYGQADDTDGDGRSWSYALHFHIKQHTARGWTEDEVTEDGAHR